MMKLVFVFVVVASFFAEHLSLPVGKERQREDVVTRCLVEVLSKALTKPDSHPLDQECKDILKAGVQHAAPVEKKNDEVQTHEEEGKGPEPEPEVPGANVKDIEALLKSVEEKRETPEDEERSQESWDLNDEKEKRIWKPTHRYHHKKPNHKRDEEVSEEVREDPDEEHSQESWSLGNEKEKRYRPTYRYTPKKHHKRDEEGLEEEREEPDEERSQESWSLGNEKEKRYRPTYRYTPKKHHKRDEEGLEEVREEPDEERSQESWSLGDEKEKREEDEDDREKRIWKPTHRYHHKKHHKRNGDSSEEEEEERRSDSNEHEEEKRHGDAEEEEEEERERDRQEALRYLAEKRSEVESRFLGEGEVYEKRTPWAYRGYYHPAWWKRSTEPHTPSHKMEELAKLLTYKDPQLASQSEPAEEEKKKSLSLTPEEEKELENIAAMDMELQKISQKMNENRSD